MINESRRQVFYALDSRYQEQARTLRHARSQNWCRDHIAFMERELRRIGFAIEEWERDRDRELWRFRG